MWIQKDLLWCHKRGRLLISWDSVFSSKHGCRFSALACLFFVALSLTKASSLAHSTMKQIIHTSMISSKDFLSFTIVFKKIIKFNSYSSREWVCHEVDIQKTMIFGSLLYVEDYLWNLLISLDRKSFACRTCFRFKQQRFPYNNLTTATFVNNNQQAGNLVSCTS